MKIPIQDGVNPLLQIEQRRTRAIVMTGAVLIVAGVVIPSAGFIVWRCVRLYAWWDKWMLISPSFYLFVYACASAMLQPPFALMRFMPVLSAQDASPRVTWPLVASQVLWAALSALFWQFVAWGAFPMVTAREIRFVPFYPWPGWLE